MAYPYNLHRKAYEEYISGYKWYEEEQKGLGEKFIDSIDKRVEEICEHPEYYSYIHDTYRQQVLTALPIPLFINFSQGGK